MVYRGAKSDSIPIDLIPEILSKLPAKSVARFRCVSKPWKSIICRQDFTELFHTKSSSNPRLLIVVKQGDECSVFSSPQPQNHYGNSSLVVAANFHTKFYGRCFRYASGLIYFTKVLENEDAVRVICNPSTGQYGILPPDLKEYYTHDTLLGFDPIGKQYKVLAAINYVDDGLVYHILTLGTENLRWRVIKSHSNDHVSFSRGIFINGVLYYFVMLGLYFKIVSFDVRSEKFKLVDVVHDLKGCFSYVINYKGKFCGSKLKYGHDGRFPIKLHMWVLEDVEKGKWSTYAHTLNAENIVVKVNKNLFVAGANASGEIVLAKTDAKKPFYVFYFNPETNALLSVEIQGVREAEKWFCCNSVYCIVDHVEDLNFDVMKTTYTATSIRPPEHSTSTSSREDRRSPGTKTF